MRWLAFLLLFVGCAPQIYGPVYYPSEDLIETPMLWVVIQEDTYPTWKDTMCVMSAFPASDGLLRIVSKERGTMFVRKDKCLPTGIFCE
jgi:hypothetical protein